jgi:hypothetical protein
LHHLDDDARKSKEAKSVKYRILFLLFNDLIVSLAMVGFCAETLLVYGVPWETKASQRQGFLFSIGNIGASTLWFGLVLL